MQQLEIHLSNGKILVTSLIDLDDIIEPHYP
jgi:hypothetical protein